MVGKEEHELKDASYKNGERGEERNDKSNKRVVLEKHAFLYEYLRNVAFETDIYDPGHSFIDL